MLASAIRHFSTKRTIPYVTKNNWKLSTVFLPIRQSSVSTESSIDRLKAWGSVAGPGSVQAPKISVPKEWRRLKTLPQWKRQMFALQEKFPHGWDPKRKLNRDEMEKLRELKAAQPQLSLNDLGNAFRISPEAVRRILKSRWQPKEGEAVKLSDRWLRRGLRLDSWQAKRTYEQQTKGQGGNNNTVSSGKPSKAKNTNKRRLHFKKLHDPGQDIF